MTEIAKLVATLKRELRARGLTYKHVAVTLELSEPSVKRLFSDEDFTLSRLAALADMVDLTLLELISKAESDEPLVRQLTPAQESEIMADEKLFLVAACVISHWGLMDIVQAYQLTDAECIGYMVKLDRLRLIDLLPGNRVRLNVSRDFDWIPDGPIRAFFNAKGQDDFLKSSFTLPDETHAFVHGMLTAGAQDELKNQVRRLRQHFSTLHEESRREPLAQRRGTGLLVAIREWEPIGFANLRRRP